MAVIVQPICYTVAMTHKTRTSGIYKIIINNKFYIGGSSYLESRLAKHKYKLKTRIHENKYFQQAFDASPEMIFEILEYCDISELLDREQSYLDKYWGTEDCLNMVLSAKGLPKRPVGFIMSDESRQKISDKLMGNTNGRFGKGISRTMSVEKRARQIAAVKATSNKPIIVIKPNGEEIKFESRTKAAEYLEIPLRTLVNWVATPWALRRQYKDWTFQCPGEL